MQPAELRPGALPGPGSAAARAALDVATEYCSPALLNHSVRSYRWAAAYAGQQGLAVDDELLYVGGGAARPGPGRPVRQPPGRLRTRRRARRVGVRRRGRLAGAAPRPGRRGDRGAHGRRGGSGGRSRGSRAGGGDRVRHLRARHRHPGRRCGPRCSRRTRGPDWPRSSPPASPTRPPGSRPARRPPRSVPASRSGSPRTRWTGSRRGVLTRPEPALAVPGRRAAVLHEHRGGKLHADQPRCRREVAESRGLGRTPPTEPCP